jgi:hypothetical protein
MESRSPNLVILSRLRRRISEIGVRSVTEMLRGVTEMLRGVPLSMTVSHCGKLIRQSTIVDRQ